MNVMVVGSGAREHCLRTLIGRTAEVVFTEDEADLIVVGPEVPLVEGYADEWRDRGKLVFGPGRDGAQLEGSKSFMKDFVARAGVPTAQYESFTDVETAVKYLHSINGPYVIKTSGLAAGKGVLVTDSLEAAEADVRDKLTGASFGDAGRTVVIEECLTGEEFSVFYLFDGKRGVALPPAQDFKRIYDNDQGPNTGGMGAYSPVPLVTDEVMEQVLDRIIEPTCVQLQRDGIDYRGVLYAGLILTTDGPKLIEYNVRFGDPDVLPSLMRYTGDVAELLASVARGDLEVEPDAITDEAVVNVVMASEGYPESSRKGDVISGVDEAEGQPGVIVFYAGTARNDRGQLVTNGGRVLDVTAVGATIDEARERVYEGVKRISFEGMQFRSDIALKAALS